MKPQDLTDIPDPAERVRQATDYISRGRASLAQAADIRRAAILEMRATMTQRQIAKAVGLSPSRIAQIEGAQQ